MTEQIAPTGAQELSVPTTMNKTQESFVPREAYCPTTQKPWNVKMVKFEYNPEYKKYEALVPDLKVIHEQVTAEQQTRFDNTVEEEIKLITDALKQGERAGFSRLLTKQEAYAVSQAFYVQKMTISHYYTGGKIIVAVSWPEKKTSTNTNKTECSSSSGPINTECSRTFGSIETENSETPVGTINSEGSNVELPTSVESKSPNDLTDVQQQPPSNPCKAH